MSNELIGILIALAGVVVALGGLILTSNRCLRQDVTQMEARLQEDMSQLRQDMKQSESRLRGDINQLGDRVARLEHVRPNWKDCWKGCAKRSPGGLSPVKQVHTDAIW